MARPKKPIKAEIKFDGDKAILTKKSKIPNKQAKTLYLSTATLDIMDEFEKKYSIRSSKLIDYAIQYLIDNLDKTDIK